MTCLFLGIWPINMAVGACSSVSLIAAGATWLLTTASTYAGFLLAGSALVWMHFAIRRMERRHFPQISSETDLPEIMVAAESAPRRD